MLIFAYANGTTHVIFEPLDFISRLVALVPKPRVNMTRFHGVFAPNSHYRTRVTPAKRGKGKKTKAADDNQDQSPVERHAAMTWAQRLKRAFNIDIETCSECGGKAHPMAGSGRKLLYVPLNNWLDERPLSGAKRKFTSCSRL